MNRHFRKTLLISMLALSMSVALAASLHAQVSGSIQIRFGTEPRWVPIGGTRVYIVRDEAVDYDMFRFNNRYYVYRDDRWYWSNQWRGSFVLVEENAVPEELYQVPREHWRHYPSHWEDRYGDRDHDYRDRDNRDRETDRYRDRDDDRYRDHDDDRWRDRDRDRRYHRDWRSMRHDFRGRPRWAWVPGTRVMVIGGRYRPAYDVFRYGNRYYIYTNNRWYMSSNWSGTFFYVEARSVPREFARVPRHHWRNYPSRWASQYRYGRY